MDSIVYIYVSWLISDLDGSIYYLLKYIFLYVVVEVLSKWYAINRYESIELVSPPNQS